MTVLQLNLETPSNSVQSTQGARRGMFKVSFPLLEPQNAHLIQGIFDGMVILHMESSHYEGVARYYATHDSFDPISVGEQTPEYIVVVDRSDETPKFYYERVTQVSMV